MQVVPIRAVVFVGIAFYLGGIIGGLLWHFIDVSTGWGLAGFFAAWTFFAIVLQSMFVTFVDHSNVSPEFSRGNGTHEGS